MGRQETGSSETGERHIGQEDALDSHAEEQLWQSMWPQAGRMWMGRAQLEQTGQEKLSCSN